MGDRVFSYDDLARNLKRKLWHAGFTLDLDDLVTTRPEGYSSPAAADLIMERLGGRLAGAPGPSEIARGRWRE